MKSHRATYTVHDGQTARWEYHATVMFAVLLSLAVLALVAPLALHAGGGEAPLTLTVNPDPDGGVQAKAVLLFPASRDVVQAVLTDYAHWPDLFGTSMRLAHLEYQEGRVITDLYIRHMLLPGERRLLCASRELDGGGLDTTLLGGDFRRYHRTWRLFAAEDGAGTHAEFDLLVEVETFAPDWLIALAMRRELETHFRLVRERVLAQGRAH